MSAHKSREESYTVDEFAQLEKISIPTVYKLMKKGVIDSYMIGRSRRIPPGQREKLHAPTIKHRSDEQRGPVSERQSA